MHVSPSCIRTGVLQCKILVPNDCESRCAFKNQSLTPCELFVRNVLHQGREDDQQKLTLTYMFILALTKHQLKSMLLNKKYTYTSFFVLIGGRVLPWSYERILEWGWGLEIPFLERIEKPVCKNGPPIDNT